MIKKINQLNIGERIWLVSIIASFIAGLWILWTRNFSQDNIAGHIKFFYSILLFLAISIAIYFVLDGKITKKEKIKNVKK